MIKSSPALGLPWWSVVTHTPSSAEDTASYPWSTRQQSLPATAREAHMRQWRPSAAKKKKKKKEKVILPFLVQGGHLSHKEFYILHLGRKEVVALPAFAGSQVSSAQSNTSAKVAYSDSLQSK